MRYNLIVFVLSFTIFLSAQERTLGLLSSESYSQEGYTLIAPRSAPEVYLINNCGEKVHQWFGTSRGTMTNYLMEDGRLFRIEVTQNNSFSGGPGGGGRLLILNKDSEIEWEYEYVSDTYLQHHDALVLPNENVLLIAWESIPTEELIAAGRDTAQINELGFWSEKIIELEPIGKDSAKVVWEWRVRDHLIQDVDASKKNHGTISNHPERINLNYNLPTEADFPTVDWLHFNGLDYNPTLDQVMISCRNFSEFWIIDHSTTTEEAADTKGGRYSKGGDLLYRWGNPQTYDSGDSLDQQLYLQHNPHWIPEGLPNAGKVMVFNNGNKDRPYSTVDLLTLPMDEMGNYLTPTNEKPSYLPEQADWTYGNAEDQFFLSPFISGMQQLPNGNTLICEGDDGRIFEIDATKQIVWDYKNPISGAGAESQGSTVIFGTDIFRAYRYTSDFTGLLDYDLSPQGPLELDPINYECEGRLITDFTEINAQDVQLSVYPNPVIDYLYLENKAELIDKNYTLINNLGQVLQTGKIQYATTTIDFTNITKGIYFLSIDNSQYFTIIKSK